MSNTSTRAYRSDWFRWLPAMGLQDGRMVIAVKPSYLSLDDLEVVEAGSVLPDMNHPGTLGCVEHVLLPEKWPKCCIQVIRNVSNVSVFVRDLFEYKFYILDTPIAEAFTVALEAPIDWSVTVREFDKDK